MSFLTCGNIIFVGGIYTRERFLKFWVWFVLGFKKVRVVVVQLRLGGPFCSKSFVSEQILVVIIEEEL
jgi:hypothetical protein